jgi:hypothetical protein
MDGPPFGGGESEDGTDGGRLDDGEKGLIKVHTWALNVPTKDPPRLASLECAVWMEFVLEHPFVGNDAGAERSRDEAPCLVAKQSIVLLLHGLPPSVVVERNTDGGWDNGRLSDSGNIGVSRVRLDSANAGPCDHGMLWSWWWCWGSCGRHVGDAELVGDGR